MTDRAEEDGWSLSDEDRGSLTRLIEALRGLVPLARSAQDLIALGEAWDAIEQILGDAQVEVNVGLSVGFREGNDQFEEGLFVCFRVNDNGIVLDELNTRYSADVGSDHFTNTYAILEPGRGFDGTSVENWLAQLEEVRGFENARLETERSHV